MRKIKILIVRKDDNNIIEICPYNITSNINQQPSFSYSSEYRIDLIIDIDFDTSIIEFLKKGSLFEVYLMDNEPYVEGNLTLEEISCEFSTNMIQLHFSSYNRNVRKLENDSVYKAYMRDQKIDSILNEEEK